MKVLLDACISPRVKTELEAAGHDVTWVGDWNEDPGDQVLLDRARKEERVLITLDKDFGALDVLWGLPYCGILRLVNFRAARQGRACLQVLASHADDFAHNALITAEPGRIRIRRRVEGPSPRE